MGILSISLWMKENRLILDSDKMEFIIIGTKPQLSKMKFRIIHINNEIIHALTSIRNLGVAFDSKMKLKYHVFKTTRRKIDLQIRLSEVSQTRIHGNISS